MEEDLHTHTPPYGLLLYTDSRKKKKNLGSTPRERKWWRGGVWGTHVAQHEKKLATILTGLCVCVCVTGGAETRSIPPVSSHPGLVSRVARDGCDRFVGGASPVAPPMLNVVLLPLLNVLIHYEYISLCELCYVWGKEKGITLWKVLRSSCILASVDSIGSYPWGGRGVPSWPGKYSRPLHVPDDFNILFCNRGKGLFVKYIKRAIY